jgi:hypothetical protein
MGSTMSRAEVIAIVAFLVIFIGAANYVDVP